MAPQTRTPGILAVAAALPDPPFEFIAEGAPAGIDVELMQAVAGELGLTWKLVAYEGRDFNGIFDLLQNGACDCIASGTTVTPERQARAHFCAPYLTSGQSLVCNIEKTPNVRSLDDLAGLVLAVQHGNTSEPVANRLKSAGRVAGVRTYAYHDMPVMLDDLEAGRIGAIMKLGPVMRWFTRDRPPLEVVQENITDEVLGVAVALDNAELGNAIDKAQARLAADGRLNTIIARWTGQ